MGSILTLSGLNSISETRKAPIFNHFGDLQFSLNVEISSSVGACSWGKSRPSSSMPLSCEWVRSLLVFEFALQTFKISPPHVERLSFL
jgi:hypothetical protein